jgi:membrane associated rhomboid family serine protease
MGWKDRAYYRDDASGGVPPVVFSFPKPPPLTTVLIIVNLAIFIAQAVTRESGFLVRWGALTFFDGLAFKQPWRWITYQYLHGGAWHIFMNLLALYFFLPALEMMWGWKKAFAFYTTGGIVAGVTFGLLCAVFGHGILIGASGSVLAALGAVALLSPQRQLILLIFPVPIRVAAALFGAFFLLSALADRSVSDAAHLGGLAFGFFAPWIGGPIVRRWVNNWQKRQTVRQRRAEIEEEGQIDQILQKVHQHGMNSLTRSEKKALARATERQRQADERAARSR